MVPITYQLCALVVAMRKPGKEERGREGKKNKNLLLLVSGHY